MISKLFVGRLAIRRDPRRARRIFAEAMETVLAALSLRDSAADCVLEIAVANVEPLIKIVNRRVGSMSYQVPMLMPDRQAKQEAIPSIVDAAKRRNGLPMADSLARALLDAFEGRA